MEHAGIAHGTQATPQLQLLISRSFVKCTIGLQAIFFSMSV